MNYLVTIFLTLMLGISGSNQTITVSGVVTGDDGYPLAGVNVIEKGTSNGTVTDLNGEYSLRVNAKSTLVFSFVGMQTEEVKVKGKTKVNVQLKADAESLQEVVVTGYDQAADANRSATGRSSFLAAPAMEAPQQFNTESYSTIHENGFKKAWDEALSTFSVDVDAASYSNMRRFITGGQMPPKDAIRIEELVNYFSYDYPEPEDGRPFSITTTASQAPWNEKHQVVQIGLKGKSIPTDDLPASNLVFLLDVSGSMNYHNKLPLLKSAFKLLVNQLRPEDRVAIVVYAGAAGTVLESTPGDHKEKMLASIEELQAGGSTAGGKGIKLAYQIAKENFIEGGNNRIMLATDGDFNIGASSDAAMERLIEEKRDDGIFLTVLGFGMGNYKDSKMETLADKGNGNYAYIDNIMEAKKVLINEFGGTLFTIAKDVKLQVEFNPNVVQAYRLIGYENRLLDAEDFNDDTKDAGEIGSGHTVTALYEVIPAGVESEFVKDVDPLKYQQQKVSGNTSEILTVKFRYKKPDGSKSKLITRTLKADATDKIDENLGWASTVASFGMLLRDSEYTGDLTYEQVSSTARRYRGEDLNGYRQEFINLVEIVNSLTSQ